MYKVNLMLGIDQSKVIEFTNGQFAYKMTYVESVATLYIVANHLEECLTWKTQIVIPLGNSELAMGESNTNPSFVLDLTPYEVFVMFNKYKESGECKFEGYMITFPGNHKGEKEEIYLLIDIMMCFGINRKITKSIVLYPEEISSDVRMMHKNNKMRKDINSRIDTVQNIFDTNMLSMSIKINENDVRLTNFQSDMDLKLSNIDGKIVDIINRLDLITSTINNNCTIDVVNNLMNVVNKNDEKIEGKIGGIMNDIVVLTNQLKVTTQ